MTNQPSPRLVPDSIVKVADGSMIEVHGEGVVVCVSHMRSYGKSLEFPRGVPTTPEYTSLVARWLAFFAEHGRLPTKTDDHPLTKAYEALGVSKEDETEPWGTCKASELDAIAIPGLGVFRVQPKEAQGDE